MIDATEFSPHCLRIGQLAKSIALSAAFGAACFLPMIADAQSTEPTVSAAVYAGNGQSTSTTVPVIDASPAGVPPGIDYRILANPHYSYAQIIRARSYGLSDEEIARAIAIADKADVPTSTILDEIRYGWTFTTIAQNYGVSSEWRDHSDTDRLNDYLAAYQVTGKGALANEDTDSGWVTTKTLAWDATVGSPTPDAPMSGDILQTLRTIGAFRTFLRALHDTGLDATLDGPGPYTVFAPSDSAFSSITRDQLKALWRNKAELTQVVEYHIIPARISSSEALAMTTPTSPATLEGDTLQVTSSKGQLMINGDLVTTADIQASNGVIHEVDSVLVPTSVQSMWNNLNPGIGATTTTPSMAPPSGGYNPNAVTPDNTTPTLLPTPQPMMQNGATDQNTTPGATNETAPSSTGLNPGIVTPDNTASPNMATPAAPQSTVQPTPEPATPNGTSSPNMTPGATGPTTGGGNTGTAGSQSGAMPNGTAQ